MMHQSSRAKHKASQHDFNKLHHGIDAPPDSCSAQYEITAIDIEGQDVRSQFQIALAVNISEITSLHLISVDAYSPSDFIQAVHPRDPPNFAHLIFLVPSFPLEFSYRHLWLIGNILVCNVASSYAYSAARYSAMAPKNRRGQGPFHFQDLPPELRNRVYHFYLIQSDEDAALTPSHHSFNYTVVKAQDTPVLLAYKHGSPRVATSSRKKSVMNLGTATLLTSRQIRDEALPLVYRQRYFMLRIWAKFDVMPIGSAFTVHPAFKHIESL